MYLGVKEIQYICQDMSRIGELPGHFFLKIRVLKSLFSKTVCILKYNGSTSLIKYLGNIRKYQYKCD